MLITYQQYKIISSHNSQILIYLQSAHRMTRIVTILPSKLQLYYQNKMNEKQKVRGRQRKVPIVCCYDFGQNQQEQQENTSPIFENTTMPMLSRQKSSNIKFKNVEHNNQQPIYELLNELYEQNSTATTSRIIQLLQSKRINPVITGSEERDDLEYFIPQIVTYMVMEKDLTDEELVTFILKGCTTDFYFAHRVYFYLKSLSVDHTRQRISKVWDFLNEKFIDKMKIYERCKLSGMEFTKSMVLMDHQFKARHRFSEEVAEYQNSRENEGKEEGLEKISSCEEWDTYGTCKYPNIKPINPKPIPKIYRKRYCQNGFMETPQFWDDLIDIGSKVCKTTVIERNDKLQQLLKQINQHIPANIYIPFFKDQIRLYTILCIWKGRLFATNTRAPYSIWVEMYREEEELNLARVEELQNQEIEESTKKTKKGIFDKIYQTISKPFSISSEKNTLNIKAFITDKLSVIEESMSKHSSTKSKKSLSKSFANFASDKRYSYSQIYQDSQSPLYKSQGKSKSNGSSIESNLNGDQILPQQTLYMDDFFGPLAQTHIEQTKKRSIYREMKSWKLVHLMIKIGDDIKQEQFAMQLINRFQYVFKKQKLDCVVFPYQVISLGPDCGLIQMLNNVTTLNGLFEKLHSQNITLRQFFNRAFPKPVQARKNFMRSLAGYSILTYFLQVKDRHNGNILINRDGYIIHIDFGFFLSNAPGKGVQLQKKVPFKLLTQYVQVIGHINSQEFFQFRRLFYKGFSAILKHRDSIITLVKMMYNSHGESMGCFIKGPQAIEQLQRRFSINQRVESFCYDLINSSLDNWRARWYDKFQYFLQKIYY